MLYNYSKCFIWNLLELCIECIIPILLNLDFLLFNDSDSKKYNFAVYLLYTWNYRENIMWIISFNPHSNPMKLVRWDSSFTHFLKKKLVSERLNRSGKVKDQKVGCQDWKIFFFFFIPEEMWLFNMKTIEALASFSPICSTKCWMATLLVSPGNKFGLCT